MSLAPAAVLPLFLCGSACAAEADPQPDADSEPFPITIEAKPSTAVINSPVVLRGTTLPLLNADVIVSIAASKATPPQKAKLPATRSADGSFTVSYSPPVAGVYTVEATAPDGRGHASTSFTVENPRQLRPDIAAAPDNLAQDSDRMVRIIRPKILALPYSPARDDFVKRLDTLLEKTGEVLQDAAKLSPALKDLLDSSASLPPDVPSASKTPASGGPGKANQGGSGGGNAATESGGTVAHNTSVGGNYSIGNEGGVASDVAVTLRKVAKDRAALVEKLGEAAQMHRRTMEELKALELGTLVCDNLDVVAEGIKWIGAMMNFMSSEVMPVAVNFAQDISSDALSKHVSDKEGSPSGAFLAGQIPKNINTIGLAAVGPAHKLTVDAGNVFGVANDLVGFAVDRVMDQYCQQFTGPVTAHMHAIFNKDGLKWWEYSYDVRGRITLHYPKDASSNAVPLKGRLEGFGTNYKIRENALSVLFPKLMVGTVQKRMAFPPVFVPDNLTAPTKQVNAAEGAVFGALATPNSFVFEVTGTASQDKLEIQVGATRTDADAKARVVAFFLSALTMRVGFTVYSLPYKPIHFIFERAAPIMSLNLQTVGKVVRGSQHYANTKGNDEAMGEYTVDIQACNPGC